MHKLLASLGTLAAGACIALVPSTGQAAMAPEHAVAVPALTCYTGPGPNYCVGGDVYHLSAGTGYEPSIVVACDFGGPLSFVSEGESSENECGKDTDQIYIRDNEELWCRTHFSENYGWQYNREFDAPGRHKINDLWSKDCTLRRD